MAKGRGRPRRTAPLAGLLLCVIGLISLLRHSWTEGRIQSGYDYVNTFIGTINGGTRSTNHSVFEDQRLTISVNRSRLRWCNFALW